MGTAGDSSRPLTVFLSGGSSSADYADAIQQVSFGTSGGLGERHITVTVDDGFDNSNAATAAIDVQAPPAPNNAPLFDVSNLNVTDYGDGSSSVFDLSVSDADNDQLTLSASATGGTVTPNVLGPTSADGINDALSSLNGTGLTYTPDSSSVSSDTVTLTVTDPNEGSDQINFVFNVFGTGPITLNGTAGNDLVFATGYQDTLQGDSGNDIFIFQNEQGGSGQDVITDFNVVGDDTIVLNGYVSTPYLTDQSDFETWADAAFEQDGADTVIHLDGADTIRLANIQKSALTASDFLIHPGSIT
jgi:hypothetical protein